MKKLLAAAIAAAVGASAPASALTYDLAADFGTSVFKYGQVDLSTSVFSEYGLSNAQQGCVWGDICYKGGDTYQVVYRANESVAIAHPGPGANQASALLFTAPTTGTYKLDGSVARADPNGGNGVTISYFKLSGSNGELTHLGDLRNFGSALSLAQTFTLNAGESFGVAVGNLGEYYYDATALSGTVAAVPEPGEWAMLAAGLGVVGWVARRRQQKGHALTAA